MKIMQIGSYGRNLGDNIAMLNIRRALSPDIEWTSQNFQNRPEVADVNKHDAVILGGGGLIEGGPYAKNAKSGYKLPFLPAFLNKIEVPIYVCGVGLNDFRGQPTLYGKGLTNFRLLVERSSLFYVRDDGSYEKLQALGVEGILECPDPGLVNQAMKDNCYELEKGFITHALNSNKSIMTGRRTSIQELKKIVKTLGVTPFPHTPKDYRLTLPMAVPKPKLISGTRNLGVGILEKYLEYDYSVAMRGHGQFVAIAKNIPTITLSTQDKLLHFAEKHDLMGYTVDTENDVDWKDKLVRLVTLLKTDKDYLTGWYRRAREIRVKSQSSFDNMIRSLNYELSRL